MAYDTDDIEKRLISKLKNIIPKKDRKLVQDALETIRSLATRVDELEEMLANSETH